MYLKEKFKKKKKSFVFSKVITRFNYEIKNACKCVTNKFP